jgi:hypothetical protein
MTKVRTGPERVGGLVDAFLDGKGLKDRVRRQEALADWDQHLGRDRARRGDGGDAPDLSEDCFMGLWESDLPWG